MAKVETKVAYATGATVVAPPLVALVIWLVGLVGLNIDPLAAAGIIIVTMPVAAFLGGYMKPSTTSKVSSDYVRPVAPPRAEATTETPTGGAPIQAVEPVDPPPGPDAPGSQPPRA